MPARPVHPQRRRALYSTATLLRDELVAQHVGQALFARSPARHCSTSLPSCQIAKPTSGRASAWRRTASMQCASSVASVFRNLRRAGVLKNSSFTSTVVPMARAAGRSSPLRASSRKALAAGRRCATAGVSSATEAMAASASPRKPMVPTDSRSASEPILLVAWRRSASGSSSRAMPLPSSSTAISRTPPASSRTVTWRGAGVERVVDQLAHHRGRALDHLAGGDLADQFVGQFADGAARGGDEEGVHERDCREPFAAADCGSERG